ncbi:hypothetical protein TNCV_4506301 [Trichonephila clavipes]|nr:hypothetical protein TNCV_4506301 [Trichonephila clavipes]
MQEKISAGVRTWGPEKTNSCTPQGIKRTVPSSVASKNHKFRRQEISSSQGTESIAGPSNQQMIQQLRPPTEESRRGARVQFDKARVTRSTHSKKTQCSGG